VRYVDTALPDSTSLGDWLISGLKNADHACLRTGFLSRPAAAELAPLLTGLLDRGGQILVVAGGAPDQADPEALELLHRVLEPFASRAELLIVLTGAFHNAKTYHLRFPDGHAEAWVGSPNLTRGGLTGNSEAAVVLDSRHAADADAVDQVLLGIETFRDNLHATPFDAAARLQLRTTYGQPGHTRRPVRAMRLTGDLASLLQDTVNQIEATATAGANPDQAYVPRGVLTGFRDLDLITGGLPPGSLTILAGRPGVGTSTLITDIVRHSAVAATLRTTMFCLGQLTIDVTQRILAAEARIHIASMRQGRMSDDDWTRLAGNIVKVSEAPLLLNTTPAADLDALCDEITALAAEEPLYLVAIDSLNMLTVRAEPGATRERQVALAARRLKELAVELGLAVVVTAELRRNTLAPGQPPQLADLRDSDVIASAADLAILVHRPDHHDPTDPRVGEADLVLAKHTYGPTATITVSHRLFQGRFVDFPEAPAEQR
jgi:HKD family nuclease